MLVLGTKESEPSIERWGDGLGLIVVLGSEWELENGRMARLVQDEDALWKE